jgi:2-succinyl-6-hydroxy-2,4-cyclohexadiene-1-carboxylate synthase
MDSAEETVHYQLAGYPATIRRYRSAFTQAPTIVALHGFTGSGRDFEVLRKELGTEAAHWICPDFMGHGESADPAVSDPYELPMALRLIDTARRSSPDPERVLLLGYSMGGRIALHYLLEEAPLPAVLIGSSPGLAEPAEQKARRDSDRDWITLLEDSVESFCEAWERQPLIRPQLELPGPLATDLAARRRRNSATGLIHSLLACGTGSLPSLWDALPKLPGLTLVHGENDTKFRDLAQRMGELNPSFRIAAIPGAGHAPHLERPGEVAQVLRASLKSLDFN